jgi:PAS domain-containing protein
MERSDEGSRSWVSIDAIPRFRAGETKPCEVQVICHDLTAQVEAAARLRASEERSRLLIEHGMEVVCVIDAAATILYVSPSVERVFGYPPDLLIGTNAMEYLHPDDRPAVQGIDPWHLARTAKCRYRLSTSVCATAMENGAVSRVPRQTAFT